MSAPWMQDAERCVDLNFFSRVVAQPVDWLFSAAFGYVGFSVETNTQFSPGFRSQTHITQTLHLDRSQRTLSGDGTLRNHALEQF
jgi:hypothetical protein